MYFKRDYGFPDEAMASSFYPVAWLAWPFLRGKKRSTHIYGYAHGSHPYTYTETVFLQVSITSLDY